MLGHGPVVHGAAQRRGRKAVLPRPAPVKSLCFKCKYVLQVLSCEYMFMSKELCCLSD